MMDSRLIILLFSLSILYVAASPYFHMFKRDKQYCGKRLVDTMSWVCQGRYNTPSKKSLSDILSYGYEDQEDKTQEQAQYPFISKEDANQIIPYRWRRQITDECCFKPCSLDHLRQYCAEI